MTLDFNAWLTDSSAVDWVPANLSEERAALAWKRISDKPTSLTFKKPDDTILSAQTVRLEVDSSASISESKAGAAPQRKAVIFGVRDHATVVDTDIAEGYRFVYENDSYRVIDTILTLGEIQGIAEANG